MQLNQNQVNQLLKLIKNPAERKEVKKYFKQLEKIGTDKTETIRPDTDKRETVKKILDAIFKSGIEIAKHKAIETLLHMFD